MKRHAQQSPPPPTSPDHHPFRDERQQQEEQQEREELDTIERVYVVWLAGAHVRVHGDGGDMFTRGWASTTVVCRGRRRVVRRRRVCRYVEFNQNKRHAIYLSN